MYIKKRKEKKSRSLHYIISLKQMQFCNSRLRFVKRTDCGSNVRMRMTIGKTMENNFLVPFKKQNRKKIPYIGIVHQVIFLWLVMSIRPRTQQRFDRDELCRLDDKKKIKLKPYICDVCKTVLTFKNQNSILYLSLVKRKVEYFERYCQIWVYCDLCIYIFMYILFILLKLFIIYLVQ